MAHPRGKPTACWTFRGHEAGAHVHVSVWCGTPAQAASQTRAKLGDLVMSKEEWLDLVDLIDTGLLYARADFDVEGPAL